MRTKRTKLPHGLMNEYFDFLYRKFKLRTDQFPYVFRDPSMVWWAASERPIRIGNTWTATGEKRSLGRIMKVDKLISHDNSCQKYVPDTKKWIFNPSTLLEFKGWQFLESFQDWMSLIIFDYPNLDFRMTAPTPEYYPYYVREAGGEFIFLHKQRLEELLGMLPKFNRSKTGNKKLL